MPVVAVCPARNLSAQQRWVGPVEGCQDDQGLERLPWERMASGWCSRGPRGHRGVLWSWNQALTGREHRHKLKWDITEYMETFPFPEDSWAGELVSWSLFSLHPRRFSRPSCTNTAGQPWRCSEWEMGLETSHPTWELLQLSTIHQPVPLLICQTARATVFALHKSTLN